MKFCKNNRKFNSFLDKTLNHFNINFLGRDTSIYQKKCIFQIISSTQKLLSKIQPTFSLFFSWFSISITRQIYNNSRIINNKKLNNLVFHGIFEHLAKSFLWVSILINDDFHTFERQKNANSGKFKFGHCLMSTTLFINSAEVIFILSKSHKATHNNTQISTKIKVK